MGNFYLYILCILAYPLLTLSTLILKMLNVSPEKLIEEFILQILKF